MNVKGLNMFAPAAPTKGLGPGRAPSESSAKEESVEADTFESSLDKAISPGSGMPSLSGPKLNERPVNPPAAKPAANNSAPAQKAPVAMSSEDAPNSLTRRVVWNEFLRKMGDLGVSAEDVMSAFATLSDEDLAAPPEQSVDQMVAALGLNGQSAGVAKQCFTDLIHKTKSKTLGEEFDSSKKQLSISAMTQQNLQRKTMLKSLDHLEKNFFLQKPQQSIVGNELSLKNGILAAPLAPQVNGLDVGQTQRDDFAPLAGVGAPGLGAPGIGAPGLGAPGMGAPDLGATGSGAAGVDGAVAPNTIGAPGSLANMTPAQLLGALPATPNSKSNSKHTPVEGAVIPLPAQQQQVMPEGITPDQILERPVGDLRSLAAMMPTPVAIPVATAVSAPPVGPVSAPVVAPLMMGAGGDARQQAAAGEDDESGDELQDNALLGMGATKDHQVLADQIGGKTDFAGKLQDAQLNRPLTPQEAIQKAEMLVHDGGGEMKVTLRPDGLGEIAMRVQVQDGKVNVQMITESAEAKKLIEHSLGDLKAGLSQNNLHVDSIKIDTAGNLGKQLEQQYQDAHRQMAHQTLEQFRQDQQGWRRSFFETGAVRPYRGQGEAQRDVNAPQRASSSKRAGSRRLDLVA